MSPPDKRPLVRPLARFVVALGLLLAPWPGLGRGFVETVGALATTIADPLLAATNVTLQLRAPVPQEHLGEWQGVIDVALDTPDGRHRHAGAIELRRVGYLQLATFLALALAWSPSGWRRRAAAAGVVMAVLGLIVAVPVLDFLESVGAIHLGVLALPVDLARRAFVAAPGMAYALPGIVWFAVRGKLSLALVMPSSSPDSTRRPVVAVSTLPAPDRRARRDIA